MILLPERGKLARARLNSLQSKINRMITNTKATMMPMKKDILAGILTSRLLAVVDKLIVSTARPSLSGGFAACIFVLWSVVDMAISYVRVETEGVDGGTDTPSVVNR